MLCSRRAISGPDARIAPWEESAVSKALRAAEGRSNKPVFEPVVGTSFNSCEEAKDFYNLYSWEFGFGVRYGRSRKNSNKYRTRQDIVCSCQVTIDNLQVLFFVAMFKLCLCIKQTICFFNAGAKHGREHKNMSQRVSGNDKAAKDS